MCHQNLHHPLLVHILWKMVVPSMQIPAKVVLNNSLQTARVKCKFLNTILKLFSYFSGVSMFWLVFPDVSTLMQVSLYHEHTTLRL